MRQEIFSTAIWHKKMPQFEQNKILMIDFLRSIRNQNPIGAINSNYNAYQAEIKNSAEMKPLFHFILFDMLKEIIEDCDYNVDNAFISSSWVNINDKIGSSNIYHTHSNTLSGVFYLNAPEGSGDLIFINEGLNKLWNGMSLRKIEEKQNLLTNAFFSIKPQEGDIFIWNSYLPHFVNPNLTQVERISVAFNIELTNSNRG